MLCRIETYSKEISEISTEAQERSESGDYSTIALKVGSAATHSATLKKIHRPQRIPMVAWTMIWPFWHRHFAAEQWGWSQGLKRAIAVLGSYWVEHDEVKVKVTIRPASPAKSICY